MTRHPRRRHAVLLAALAAGIGCTEDPAPPFEPTGSGTIAGRLFFDVDNNGAYSPVGGDQPFGARSLALFERGTTKLILVTQSDAQGSFTFTGVPTGTHHVFVDRNQLIAGNDTLRLCQTPAPVSVYNDEQSFLSLNARLGCVIPISQAIRATLGDFLTVSGIVTAAPGTFRGDNLYMQDASGGIQIFGLPGGLGLAVGDSIEVSGTFQPFRTEPEIVSPRVSSNVKKGVGVPDPRDLTTAAMAAITPTSANFGRLIRVTKVTVGSFSSGNAPIDDGSGPAQVRLDGNVAGTVPQATFQQGQCYTIVGVVGIFDNTPQLKLRGPGDVSPVSCQ
jgi:hypothetical protein